MRPATTRYGAEKRAREKHSEDSVLIMFSGDAESDALRLWLMASLLRAGAYDEVIAAGRVPISTPKTDAETYPPIRSLTGDTLSWTTPLPGRRRRPIQLRPQFNLLKPTSAVAMSFR